MSHWPSDCIDHGEPHLIYVTTDHMGSPIMLTIVDKEGAPRHRWPLSDTKSLLLGSDMIHRVAQRPPKCS